jgi:NADPH:quinone reductase-like Zn-dependent oxidoreductase
MKAAVLTAFGDVDGFQYQDFPEPRSGPNEIMIRMAGASINPIDWKLRSGALQAFMPLQLPTVLGKDASGEVVAVGSAVSAFRVGAHVLGFVDHGYAEFVAAPVESWAEVPPKLDLVDAGALPLVLLTGTQLIEEAVGVREGEQVLVTGATGSVGRTAVFVARSKGARVYAGVRGVHREEAAKLGSDVVVVAIDDEGEINKLPVLDAIADTVGGDTIKRLLGRVKPGGTIGSVVGEPAGAKDRGLVVHAFLTHPDPKMLARMAAAVAEGRLLIPIAKRFPLREAGMAMKAAQEGLQGKVLLTG